MNRALHAERAAVQAVAECTGRAQDMLAQAQAQAHRISERTNARISLLHARCARATSDHVDQLLREEGRLNSPDPAHTVDDDTLARAVQRLAAALSGEDAS